VDKENPIDWEALLEHFQQVQDKHQEHRRKSTVLPGGWQMTYLSFSLCSLQEQEHREHQVERRDRVSKKEGAIFRRYPVETFLILRDADVSQSGESVPCHPSEAQLHHQLIRFTMDSENKYEKKKEKDHAPV